MVMLCEVQSCSTQTPAAAALYSNGTTRHRHAVSWFLLDSASHSFCLLSFFFCFFFSQTSQLMYTRGIPLLLCFPPPLSASPFLYFFPLLVMCSVLLWLLGINLWHIKRCGGGKKDAWGEKFISILNLFAECLQRNIWESQRFIYVNCWVFCCFFYSTVMQLLLVKIEVGSVRVCTCAKNTHCACSTCQCVHLYLWGGVLWQQTFSRSVIERWDTGVCSMLVFHFITCTQVHTKYKQWVSLI